MRLRKAGQLRPLCIDLENRPLAYWYDGQTTSEITAIAWKWSGDTRVNTLLLRSSGKFETDTGRTVKPRTAYQLFVSELEKAGIVYGHNIRRHDLPMLQRHLDRLELPSLRPLLTTDTYKDLPKGAGMSVSLENLAGYWGLDGEKHRMSQPDWENANRLTPSGLVAARERVSTDVLLQEKLRDKALELGKLGPPRVWSASR